MDIAIFNAGQMSYNLPKISSETKYFAGFKQDQAKQVFGWAKINWFHQQLHWHLAWQQQLDGMLSKALPSWAELTEHLGSQPSHTAVGTCIAQVPDYDNMAR